MVRFKNRYIALKIDNKKSFTQPLILKDQELYNEIVNEVKYLHGTLGFNAVKPGLKVNYCNEVTGIVILKVRHGPHKLVLSALPLIRNIKNTDCTLKILYIGATLQHCYKVILSYQKKEFDLLLPRSKSEEVLNTKLKPFENKLNLMQ